MVPNLTKWIKVSRPLWCIIFGDLSSEKEVPGVSYVNVKAFLKESLGFDHDFLPLLVAMHLVFILPFVFIFIFIFAFGIKYINL